MSSSYLKKFLVKIEVREKYRGTGVIFKANESDDIFYILTASHNFSKDRTPLGKDHCFPGELIVKHSINSNKNLKILDDKVYTIKNSESDSVFDIALLIIDSSKAINNEDIRDIPCLDIYDTINESNQNQEYFTLGYPEYLKNAKDDDEIAFFQLQYSQEMNIETEEKFKNTDGSINFHEVIYSSSLQGMSGSGIFLYGKGNKVSLRGIIIKAIPKNDFQAIRLDIILDKINDRIDEISNNLTTAKSLPKIQPSTKIFVNNEKINLSEFLNFQNFREKILAESELPIPRSDINITHKEIRKIANDLKEKTNKATGEIINISNQYAHLAILAHDNDSKILTTAYFQKAISLNQAHKHALLHEHAQRTGNIDLIRQTKPKNIIDKIKKYNKLIEFEKDDRKKSLIIREAIRDIIITTTTEKDVDEKIKAVKNYIEENNNLCRKDNNAFDISKYKNLADFYFSLPEHNEKNQTREQEHALFYYMLSKELLEKNQSTEKPEYKIIAEEIDENISKLKIIKNIDIDHQIDEIKSLAHSIILANEDKTIKELIQSLHREIKELKEKDYRQEEAFTELMAGFFSLNINIEEQINQNKDTNLNTKNHNNNTQKTEDLLNLIESQVKSIKDKYLINLDETTKNELKNSIHTPFSDDFSDIQNTLLKANKTIENFDYFSKNADNHIAQLIKISNEDRSDFLEKITDKNNLLEKTISSLKKEIGDSIESFKNTTIDKIEKSFIDQNQKNDLMKTINDACEFYKNELKKLLSSNITDSKKALHDLSEIKTSYSKLEKNIEQSINTLTKTNESIASLKTNSLRFERSILHTLHNINRKQDDNENISTKIKTHNKTRKWVIPLTLVVIITALIVFVIISYI